MVHYSRVFVWMKRLLSWKSEEFAERQLRKKRIAHFTKLIPLLLLLLKELISFAIVNYQFLLIVLWFQHPRGKSFAPVVRRRIPLQSSALFQQVAKDDAAFGGDFIRECVDD
jgi:hypothetical protein